MKTLLLLAAFTAVALARPETYREKEDFQYSRSSSDEGTKSGFYGAQRGNMGGNFERAHNMDDYAQTQMSSAIKNVEGEIGDSGNLNTGSVYTAANTRGLYSQRNYDLSNLQGRNFQDNSFGNSGDLSSHSSGYGSHSSLQNSGYAGQSQYRALQSNARYNAGSQVNDNQEASSQVNNGYREFGRQSGYSSEYRRQHGYNDNAFHQQSNVKSSQQYVSENRNRLIGAAPVKIVIRPGSTVHVPVTAETYQDASATVQNVQALHRDVELVAKPDENQITPSNVQKNYESSYSYNKEWEKHSTRPVAVALAAPSQTVYVNNNDLYDESLHHSSQSELQGNALNSQNLFTSQAAGYNTQSQNRKSYDSQFAQTKTASGLNRNLAYNSATAVSGVHAGNLNNFDSTPKSYQSSYAYHKSWERQGDPYVIQPAVSATDDQTSQRLTAASNNYNSQGYSHHAQSQYRKSHESYSADCDCEVDDGTNRRVVRSAPNQEYDGQEQQVQNANFEDFSQQSQSGYDNLQSFQQQSEDLGQEVQRANLEDFGQQAQSGYQNLQSFQQNQANLGQEVQKEKLEDFGQHSQSNFENLASFDQQSQNSFNSWANQQEEQGNIGQQTQDLQPRRITRLG